MAKIFCPNKQYTGVSASVPFFNGVGETDNKRLIAWFKDKGYTVEETASNNPPENLEDMSVKQLQAFAAEKNIDVKGLKKKPEILEKIQSALAELEDEDGEDDGENEDQEDEDEDEDEDGEES